MRIFTDWMRGIEEERREVLGERIPRQLRRRFGPLPPEWEARIHSLSTPDLEELGAAVLDFTAPSDVDAWLDRRQPQS